MRDLLVWFLCLIALVIIVADHYAPIRNMNVNQKELIERILPRMQKCEESLTYMLEIEEIRREELGLIR